MQKKLGFIKFNEVLTTAIILIAATCLCEILYRMQIGDQNISIVMVLAVFIVSAITDGYWYGLIATLAGVFIYDYLVSEPRLGFSVALGFPTTLSIMLFVTLVTSSIATLLRHQMKMAQEKECRAELLYEINRKLLSSRDTYSIVKHAVDYLYDHVNCSMIYYKNSDNSELIEVYRKMEEGDIFCDSFERSSGKGGKAYYKPIMLDQIVYGALRIFYRQGEISKSKLLFLNLISEQMAQAFHVQALTEKQQEVMIIAESEKARNSLLRGISHDLRTPLTSMIGASAILLEGDEFDAGTRNRLIENIHMEAQWLLSMVENILSVTRINQSDMKVDKNEEAAEEVVSEAVALFRKRCPLAVVTILPTDNLILVPMDALLITQVINNILDNSQRHAKGDNVQIQIEIKEVDADVIFTVSDNGAGIDESVFPYLFEIVPVQREYEEDSSRGMGMGLSICKTIIEAHKGWIRAKNKSDGGAQISFALPVEKEAEREEQTVNYDS